LRGSGLLDKFFGGKTFPRHLNSRFRDLPNSGTLQP
jgi:hypothetical protein